MHRQATPIILAALVGTAAACKTPLPAPTYALTATFSNSADVPQDGSLQLAYTGAARTGTRLVSSEAMGFTYLEHARMSLARGGTSVPSTDGYYLQVISRPSVYVNQGSDSTVTRTGDWGWMEAHASDSFVLALQPDTLEAPTSIAAPDLSPRRTAVSAWLATVEEDDVMLPYFIPVGSPACHPLSPTDCFDVQSIAMMLRDGVAGGLQQAVDPSGGGRDPEPLVRATGGDFSISFIPNVVHAGLNGATQRTRGVGFVLRMSFEARVAGGDGAIGPLPVDVGTPYHQVTVMVPIAIHFGDDGTGQLQVTIDPLDFVGSTAGPDMPSHVAVEVHNPLGTPIDAAAGAAIAETARRYVVDQLSANGPLKDLASGVLAAYFNLIRPTRALPPNFDVVLIGGGTTQGVPEPMALSGAAGADGPHLVFLE